VRKLLGLNYYRLATAYLRLGETEAAAENYRKCLDVRAQLQKEIPNNVGLQIDLMIAKLAADSTRRPPRSRKSCASVIRRASII
jgi:hypothetical protein